ncbi:MAG: TonB-system energizer ExbB [Proteobacteria bacterium]|jgi:biopolymer transport protein ExbB|nr:TonB-system energizer ExbB [Pseudomonadota bacterium]MBU0965362.1 TonB-system energizer ExbB [Pseudomonadota bacterium]
MEWLQAAVDYGIIGLLIVLSAVAVAVGIERYRYLKECDAGAFKNKKDLELALTRKMHFIATIGSNAPYIGLLGTVLGIMQTFYVMGRDGMMDTGKIMTGLALALKATAVGLLVAIPAITMYNLLMRKAREIMLEWESRHGG